MNEQGTLTTGILPDHEIIARVLRGEKELYAQIIKKYNQRLYRVAMSIINDDAEAEDIMQTAYIKAYENLSKFEFRSVFSTWLTRILINESLLRLKKRKRSFIMNEDTMNNELYHQHAMDDQTPDKKLVNNELKGILEKLIAELPEKYRTVFIMRELENMNVAETQECLDLSEANVKVRLNRAKVLLRESINNYYKKEDIMHFHLLRCDRMVKNVMSLL